ncbi:MAG: LacI family DNA-binding transcriptional regulator [Sphaerochaetaceae bacterium]|nr:LacI family DNA-binding transcriptional regulator [Sphaerochaetaceae bacterium]
MKKNKVTLQDIANSCDISISTVSRALNGTAPVNRDLLKKIQQTIKELGYVQSSTKQVQKMLKIGLIVPDVLNPWLAGAIHAASEEATRQGVGLSILDVTQDIVKQETNLQSARKWGLDGLIVIGTKLPPSRYVEFSRRTGIPVMISRHVEISELPCILIDYETSIHQAVKHLVSLGHTRIACMSDLPEWDSSKIKLQSIQKAFSQNGLSLPPHYYTWCFPNISEGAQSANKLLNLSETSRPTAIIAFDDLIAIGALSAAGRKGLRVPQDLSIIGFNDIEISSYTNPSLTSISLPTYQIGQTLVQKMSESLKSGQYTYGSLKELSCSLVVRESTGPVPHYDD